MRAGDKAGFYVTIIKIKERKTEMTKVYVADDDRHIRELVGSFLKSVGLEVELFETGDQLFFFKIFGGACSCCCFGCHDARKWWFSIAKRLRQQSEVPIVLLTARDSDKDYAEDFSSGIDDYVTKPFSMVKLVLRIKAILARNHYSTKSEGANLSFGDLTLSDKERIAYFKQKPINWRKQNSNC